MSPFLLLSCLRYFYVTLFLINHFWSNKPSMDNFSISSRLKLQSLLKEIHRQNFLLTGLLHLINGIDFGLDSDHIGRFPLKLWDIHLIHDLLPFQTYQHPFPHQCIDCAQNGLVVKKSSTNAQYQFLDVFL